MQDQPNTPLPPSSIRPCWWRDPQTDAERFALDWLEHCIAHAERLIAFMDKHKPPLESVKQMFLEAEFAASDFGRRMDEEDWTLAQSQQQYARLTKHKGGGIGIE